MDRIQENFILENPNSERIDALLAKRFTNYSRTYFQELIEAKEVLINGKPLKKRQIPLSGDNISVTFKKRAGPDLAPQAIPLSVLYEDHHIVAVNKSPNMVVHPAPGNWSSTFVNALLNHCNLPDTSDSRPGIVHRLDKETSGVLLAAKTEEAHQKLIQLFQAREIKKEYVAITLGKVKSGLINLPIERSSTDRKKMCVGSSDKAKEAITEVELLAYNGTYSKVLLKPKTGRTHQLRVHLSHLGFPILGDKVYGNTSHNNRYGISRHYLHANKIAFVHPITGKYLEISAPLPKEMESIFICGY